VADIVGAGDGVDVGLRTIVPNVVHRNFANDVVAGVGNEQVPKISR